MDADGSFRYAELVGDLGVGVPGSDQTQQFLLPGSEPVTTGQQAGSGLMGRLEERWQRRQQGDR